MQVQSYSCHDCGSETSAPGGICHRCKADLGEYLSKGTLKRAYDVLPRRFDYVNQALPYTERPREIIRLLEKSGVDLLGAKLLIDVGSGRTMILRDTVVKKYPNLKVLGYDADVHGAVTDLRSIDLEHAKLPHADGEVDIAVCSHVLEHVDNNHSLTDELFRVAKNVIILLPNSILWTTLAKVVLRDTVLPMIGLPLEKPIDRHRWIYTVAEATRWMRHVAGKWERNLDVVYRTDWRLPTFFGRLHPALFVIEMSYILTKR